MCIYIVLLERVEVITASLYMNFLTTLTKIFGEQMYNLIRYKKMTIFCSKFPF